MSEYLGNSSISNRSWVWGNDGITAYQGSNGVMISQLDQPRVTSSGASLGSPVQPVQPVPIVAGTYMTFSSGGSSYTAEVTGVSQTNPNPPTPSTPTTSVVTTTAPTTPPPTTAPPTTTVPTTPPPTTPPPTTAPPPTTPPPTTPPP